MIRFFEYIKKYHGYAVYVAKAQLKSEVASSYLNWIWWVLEPFLTMIIYVIVFGWIFRASEPNYTVFLFVGILMWNFFSGVVKSSISIVRNNYSIISRIYVPKYILLISSMYQYAFKFCFGMLIEFAMIFLYGIRPDWRLVYIIPFLAGFFLFTFGCSSILMHFGVYIYDLTYAITIALNFIMFLSGIFYSVEGRIEGIYGRIAERANPAAFFIASVRSLLIYHKIPSFSWLLIWCLVSAALSAFGIMLIHKNENNYVKVI